LRHFLVGYEENLGNTAVGIVCSTVSLLSCPSERQLPRVFPANAGFLCDKAASLRDRIKCTPCIANNLILKSELFIINVSV
jgi:hypothetical protein